MRRALAEHPVVIGDGRPSAGSEERPEVSFVIGHRGMDRTPQLLLTLRSIAAQQAASVECIVVEQADQAETASMLPDWVRYVHTSPPREEMPYCRSWAFNVGSRMARGSLLVLHDGDMLAPTTYAADLLSRRRQGYEVINTKRYVFYLSRTHSRP